MRFGLHGKAGSETTAPSVFASAPQSGAAFEHLESTQGRTVYVVQCASTCSSNNAPCGANPYGLYVLATPAGLARAASACTNASGG